MPSYQSYRTRAEEAAYLARAHGARILVSTRCTPEELLELDQAMQDQDVDRHDFRAVEPRRNDCDYQYVELPHESRLDARYEPRYEPQHEPCRESRPEPPRERRRQRRNSSPDLSRQPGYYTNPDRKVWPFKTAYQPPNGAPKPAEKPWVNGRNYYKGRSTVEKKFDDPNQYTDYDQYWEDEAMAAGKKEREALLKAPHSGEAWENHW